MWSMDQTPTPRRGARRWLSGWMMVVPLLALAACSDSGPGIHEPEPEPEPDPEEQPTVVPPVILEVEWARDWLGLYWVGFQIDEEGNAWGYDVSHRPWGQGRPWGQPPEPTALSEEELTDKFAQGRTLLGVVEPGVMMEMLELAQGVEAGEYFRPNAACNDAGMFSYIVHRYDSDGGVYRPIILRQDGNEMRQGRSPEALVLGRWLRSLVVVHPVMYDAWIESCASEDWESFPPRPTGS